MHLLRPKSTKALSSRKLPYVYGQKYLNPLLSFGDLKGLYDTNQQICYILDLWVHVSLLILD